MFNGYLKNVDVYLQKREIKIEGQEKTRRVRIKIKMVMKFGKKFITLKNIIRHFSNS